HRSGSTRPTPPPPRQPDPVRTTPRRTHDPHHPPFAAAPAGGGRGRVGFRARPAPDAPAAPHRPPAPRRPRRGAAARGPAGGARPDGCGGRAVARSARGPHRVGSPSPLRDRRPRAHAGRCAGHGARGAAPGRRTPAPRTRPVLEVVRGDAAVAGRRTPDRHATSDAVPLARRTGPTRSAAVSHAAAAAPRVRPI